MTSRPRKLAKPIKSMARLSALLANKLRQAETAKEKRNNVIEVHSSEVQELKDYYPLCPKCQSSNVKRAGKDKGHQRFKCKDCSRTFGPGFNLVVRCNPVALTCYHCGAVKEVVSLGSSIYSGRIGYCRSCRRRFTQGGRSELKRYHLCLKFRVAQLKLPEDVAQEVFQFAAEQVLLGVGYCWNIPLNSSRAYRAVRGEFKELGSANTKYIEQAEGRIVPKIG